MAAEALSPDTVVAASNILLGATLTAASVIVIVFAFVNRMPWSMLAGILAVSLLALTTLLSAIARLELYLIPNVPFILLVLRFSALILLAGAGWTLGARYVQRRVDR